MISVALAAPQHQQAAQYPAGVNPQDCPNFPLCDNERLHNPQARWAQPPAQPAWNQPAPAWNQPAPSWNPAPNPWNPAPAPAWNAYPSAPAPAPAGGDKYPAGVSPHSCPNYPFCDITAGHGAVQAPPLPGWTERLYPAGVSPHECPNFPYCH